MVSAALAVTGGGGCLPPLARDRAIHPRGYLKQGNEGGAGPVAGAAAGGVER